MPKFIDCNDNRVGGGDCGGRDADEISVIAASLTQLGDTLATIAAQKAFCESSKGA